MDNLEGPFDQLVDDIQVMSLAVSSIYLEIMNKNVSDNTDEQFVASLFTSAREYNADQILLREKSVDIQSANIARAITEGVLMSLKRHLDRVDLVDQCTEDVGRELSKAIKALNDNRMNLNEYKNVEVVVAKYENALHNFNECVKSYRVAHKELADIDKFAYANLVVRPKIL